MKQQFEQARWIAILALTGTALYVCWLMLRPFIDVLGWAAVLVIFFYPLHKRLAARIRRTGLAALASSLLALMLLVAPLGFLIAALANELTRAAHSLPARVAASLEALAPLTMTVSEWLHDRLLIDVGHWQTFIADQLNSIGAALLGQSISLIGDILAGVFKAFFVIFTMYYLFRDGDKFVNALPRLLPFERANSEALINRVKQVVGAGVYGVVSIAMVQGLLSVVAFWSLGVPSPVLWGVLTTFICMIPIAGSFLVWLPASAYLIVNGQWGKGIGLILWGALVISTIDNFLRPRLIKNQTKLHELFIFFSVLGGIRVFGLIGIVLGPVVFAIALALLETWGRNGEISEQSAPSLTNQPSGFRLPSLPVEF